MHQITDLYTRDQADRDRLLMEYGHTLFLTYHMHVPETVYRGILLN